jgi:hypothetical protein
VHLSLELIAVDIDETRQDEQSTAVETLARSRRTFLDQSAADVDVTLLENPVRPEDTAIDQ